VSEASAFTVFLAALVTAIATGLGAVPLHFFPRLSTSWVGISNGVAGGCMLAASGLLLYEAVPRGLVGTAIGFVVGIGFVAVASRVLSDRKDVHFGMLAGTDARRALLLVGVMTVHSFAEGVGVGVSFGEGGSLGLVTTIAIAVHNIPEGLAISLLLVPRGIGVLRAAGWSIISSLPQPLVAVPAFLFVTAFATLLPAGLGFAGGAMLWMVAAQVVPDALRSTSRRAVVISLCVSALALALLETVLITS
jgi:zinc transporter, ZIP family